MNLRSIDLNLLVVFDALMRYRNVTHAAQAIGLSQPAFSNALTRLRERLNDELFIRTPGGMRPTPWALELSGPVGVALGDIQDALDGASFNPDTSKRSFNIASQDYGMMVFIPPLLERIRKEAPGITMRVIMASIHPGEYLDTQKADLALFSWPNPPERFVSESLLDEDWVCVMRPDHPLAGKRMTLKMFSEAQHLSVSPEGDPKGWVDDVLAKRDRTRHVVLTMATYPPTPMVLETTDLIMACPRRLGIVFKQRIGLAMTSCPVAPPSAFRSIDMIWHNRLANHPAQIWMRDLLRGVAGSTEL